MKTLTKEWLKEQRACRVIGGDKVSDILKAGIRYTRKPVTNYRDVQRNKELYRKARLVAAGAGLMLLGWVLAVVWLSQGGVQ